MKAKDLKNSILQLAIQGKLVPQDPNDEPASKLLEKIRAAKQKLVKEGKIKKDKQESFIYKGDDNNYYEKIGNEVRNITDEIPFEIPDSWEWVRLSSAITNIPSKSFQINTKKILDSGLYPVVSQSMNFIDGFSNETNKVLRLENPILLFGDHTRVLKLINFDFIVGADGTKLLLPLLKDITKYLYYLIRYFIINMPTRGYSRHYQFIKDQVLPLPPLEEQQRIIKQIELLEPYIEEYDKAERELTTLNEIFPEQIKKSILQYAIRGKLVPQNPKDEPASVLLDKIKVEKQKLIKAGKIKKDKVESYIYKRDNRHYEKIGDKEVDITDEIPFEIPDSWSWVRLKNITIQIVDGSHNPPPNKGKSDFVMISSKNVNNTGIDFTNPRYLSEADFHREDQRTNIQKDDILLTIVGTIGRCAKVNVDKRFTVQRSVAVIKANSFLINKDFLVFLLQSYTKYFEERAKGTAQLGIYLNTLASILIPFPPLDEQKRIAAKVKELLKLLPSNG